MINYIFIITSPFTFQTNIYGSWLVEVAAHRRDWKGRRSRSPRRRTSDTCQNGHKAKLKEEFYENLALANCIFLTDQKSI